MGAKDIYFNEALHQNLRKEQLLQLYDCAVEMRTERNLDRLLTFIAKRVTDALNADRCAIFILDEDTEEIYSRVALGEKKELRFPKGTGVAGQTIISGEPYLTNNPYENPHFNKSVDIKTGYVTRNLLSVPLLDQSGKAIGCVQALNKRDEDFDEVDQHFLIAFAALAASEVISAVLFTQKAKLIDDLKKKVHQLEVLSELENMSYDLESSDEFFKAAVQQAVKATSAEAGSILLLDELGEKLTFTYNCGRYSDQLSNMTIDAKVGFAGRVLASGKSMFENHVYENKNSPHFSDIDQLLNQKTRSLGASPIIFREKGDGEQENIGVIEVINHEKGSFSAADMSFLDSLSGQISSRLLRKKLIQEKENTQRFTAIGQLAGTIVHDFKSPMSIIRMSAELMCKPTTSEEKKTRYTKMIHAQVDRCNSMILDILEFSRGKKNFNFDFVDMEDFFRDIHFLIDTEADRKGIKFTTDLVCHDKVKIDGDKFKRVIFNLLGNALEVLKEGDLLRMSCRDKGEYIEFRIEDSGPGIPEEIREKLFEAFVTSGKAHGTGLGLSIAKDIVDAHKGTIRLDAGYKEGAAFVIDLPKS